MDKITIILIIIIILICCSLLSITGYIGIKVYTKPLSPMPITQPLPQQSNIPSSQPRIFDSSVIITPAPSPVLIKRDISEDTVTPEMLSVNMPIPQELSSQGPTFNKSSPVPFNSPTGPTATPIISPTPISRISTLQPPSRTLQTPPSRTMTTSPRVTSLKR